MKTCSKCKETLPHTEFYNNFRTADGFYSYCKPCSRAKTYTWRASNNDKVIIHNKTGRAKNLDALKVYFKQWCKENQGIRNSLEAVRKSAKLNRTPKWLSKDDKKQITNIYKVCAWLNAWKLEKYQVDHILPLQGKDVSGLHVPWNLQIITAQENASKGNRI